jgi:hypothetical protein
LAFKIPVTIDGQVNHLSFDPTLGSLDSKQVVVAFFEENSKGYREEKHREFFDLLVEVVDGVNKEYRDANLDPSRLIALGKRLKRLKAFEDAAEMFEKAAAILYDAESELLANIDHSRAETEKIRSLYAADMGFAKKEIDNWHPLQGVARETYGNLSSRAFIEKYERSGFPVVFEQPLRSGLEASMGETMGHSYFWSKGNIPWDWDFFVESCGNTTAMIRAGPYDLEGAVPSETFWFGWKIIKVRLHTYIGFIRNKGPNTFYRDHNIPEDWSTYLFDWSLRECKGKNAPLHDFLVPKYFANDYLLKYCKTCFYSGSWPSLFINPPKVNSPLHIDSFGSAFFSIQLKGTKTWRLFSRDDAPKMYPRDEDITKFYVTDSRNTSRIKEQFPLFLSAPFVDVVLRPNEMIYVAAGTPHQVLGDKTEPNLMIGYNYINKQNLDYVLSHVKPKMVRENTVELTKSWHKQVFDVFEKFPASEITAQDVVETEVSYYDLMEKDHQNFPTKNDLPP